MILENKIISQRQSFRMGVLETITLSMVVIPYATVNLAGKYHFFALIIGLILGGIYMTVLYFLARAVPVDMDKRLDNATTGLRIASILYMIRFIIRAGIILLFFAKTIQEYLLQSFSLWVIIIAFALVCGYGASRDIEKRGRMLELLFPWMIVPIILVAVFSISSINPKELLNGLQGINYDSIKQDVNVMDVIRGGYVAFLIITTSELMLFTIPRQRENNWRNTLKTGIWILISIFLAYIFIIGILGGHWVARDSQAALNVMEAAFVPGGILQRADYPVLAFWVIGVFAIMSGYMFFAKEAFLVGSGLRHKKLGQSGLWLIIVLVVAMTWVWSLREASIYLADYMLYADVLISLFIPLVVYAKKNIRDKRGNVRHGKRSLNMSVVLIFLFVPCFLLTGCHNNQFRPISKVQESVESRGYVTKLIFKNDKEITFTIADIKKYISDATGSFDTKDETLKGDSLMQVVEAYYEDKGRQLDLGHLSEIVFEDVSKERLREYVIEMSAMSQLGKSVIVRVTAGDEKYEIDLRTLIKNVFEGEESS